MDKTVQEAKAEVEAFTINKMNQLGMEKLNEMKDLPISKDPLQQLTKQNPSKNETE